MNVLELTFHVQSSHFIVNVLSLCIIYVLFYAFCPVCSNSSDLENTLQRFLKAPTGGAISAARCESSVCIKRSGSTCALSPWWINGSSSCFRCFVRFIHLSQDHEGVGALKPRCSESFQHPTVWGAAGSWRGSHRCSYFRINIILTLMVFLRGQDHFSSSPSRLH